MALKVNFEIAFGGKTVATDIAFVGTFTSMRSDMNLQSRVGSKYLATEFAPVLKVRIIFGKALRVGEICQAVLKQTMRGIVQDALCLLLQQFKGV